MVQGPDELLTWTTKLRRGRARSEVVRVSMSTYVMVAGFVFSAVIYVCAYRDISRELREVDEAAGVSPTSDP